MSHSDRNKSTSNPKLDLLIDQYLQLVKEGKPVDVEMLCSDSPELADELRAFISAESRPEQLAGSGEDQVEVVDKASHMTNTTPPPHVAMETLMPGFKTDPDIGSLGKMFGRYKLIELLGQGGMGSVFLAEDTSLQRRVALKIPKFSKDHERDLMTRFLREARSAAAVSHPNICQVLDIGEEQGTTYLTMAFIEGETLTQQIGEEQFSDERQIVQLMITLSQALAKAHAEGIIHRDLKPGNVMINTEGSPFITDFGLARKLDQEDESRLTKEGTILGTPAYMSPEQIEGDPKLIGPQSDLYSLGVIFYELLTGDIPFRGTIPSMLGQILRDQPSPPSKHRQDLDKQLEAICLRMLEKSCDVRYATCGEVAKELQAWFDNKSVLSTPPKSPAKKKQPVSRKLQMQKQNIDQLLKTGQLTYLDCKITRSRSTNRTIM